MSNNMEVLNENHQHWSTPVSGSIKRLYGIKDIVTGRFMVDGSDAPISITRVGTGEGGKVMTSLYVKTISDQTGKAASYEFFSSRGKKVQPKDIGLS